MNEARKFELHTGTPARHGLSDDAILHEKARELLRSGELPNRRPNRIWGGPSVGASQCMLCGGAMVRDEDGLHLRADHFAWRRDQVGRPAAAR